MTETWRGGGENGETLKECGARHRWIFAGVSREKLGDEEKESTGGRSGSATLSRKTTGDFIVERGHLANGGFGRENKPDRKSDLDVRALAVMALQKRISACFP